MINIHKINIIKRMNLAVAVLCGHAFTLLGELPSIQVIIINMVCNIWYMDHIWHTYESHSMIVSCIMLNHMNSYSLTRRTGTSAPWWAAASATSTRRQQHWWPLRLTLVSRCHQIFNTLKVKRGQTGHHQWSVMIPHHHHNYYRYIITIISPSSLLVGIIIIIIIMITRWQAITGGIVGGRARVYLPTAWGCLLSFYLLSFFYSLLFIFLSFILGCILSFIFYLFIAYLLSWGAFYLLSFIFLSFIFYLGLPFNFFIVYLFTWGVPFIFLSFLSFILKIKLIATCLKRVDSVIMSRLPAIALGFNVYQGLQHMGQDPKCMVRKLNHNEHT